MALAKELKIRAKNISVLYAEDDPEIREEVTEFLKKFFQDLHVVQNGEEGLEAFRKTRYDLVVTDIKMPKLNGLAMAKAIKKLAKNTQVIVTSAFDDKALLLNAIETSIDHYVVKPIDFSSLIIMLYKSVTLISLEKRVEKLNRHKQAILDFQENMVFTAKEGKLTSANKRFLQFFQLASVREISEKQADMVDFVVKESGYFYPVEKEEWVRELESTTEYDMLIKLLDRRLNEAQPFLLKIGKLEEFGETIVTLTNISGFAEGAPTGAGVGGACFYFDQENIANFFSFLRNEINRSKRYSLPLSIVQFVVEAKGIGSELFEEIDKVVVKELALMDSLAKPTPMKYIVAKVDTELEDANRMAKKIHELLKKRYSDIEEFRCRFGVVGLGAGDAVQDVLSRAENLLDAARESGSTNIKSDYYPVATPGATHQEKKLIYDKLSAAATKKQAIKVISFFNGMKVVDEAQVYSVSQRDEKAVLKLSKKQHATLKDSDTVFVSVDDYFKEIEGRVAIDSYDNLFVEIADPSFAKSSPLQREYVRVATEPGLQVVFDKGKNEFHGNILDISIKSLACEVPVIKEMALGKVFGIEFALPMDKKEVKINVNAEIYKVEKSNNSYKVVLLLLGQGQIKRVITSYISKREQRVASEMRNGVR